MGKIIAIDPGIRGCGVAEFDSDGKLLRAAYIRNTSKKGNRANEAANMATTISYWVSWNPTLVVEWPQIYASRIREGKTKEDPNDTLALAGIVSAVSARLCCSVVSYLPHEWKDNVPKAVMGQRILGRLTLGERAVVDAADIASSLLHNVIDAVGLGLYHLGRLKPKRGNR